MLIFFPFVGKQTMGFPLLTFQDRSDNKLYRLQTPQSPLVRPYMYDYYDMDNYPIGTNAIVAVISYTGYDMEDAMVSAAKRCTSTLSHFLPFLLTIRSLKEYFLCARVPNIWCMNVLLIPGLSYK